LPQVPLPAGSRYDPPRMSTTRRSFLRIAAAGAVVPVFCPRVRDIPKVYLKVRAIGELARA